MKPSLLLLSLLLIPSLAIADTLTGKNWILMNDSEKSDFVEVVVQGLSDRGVEVALPVDEYIRQMNKWVSEDPKIHDQALGNVLTSLIYQLEPNARQGIDGLREK